MSMAWGFLWLIMVLLLAVLDELRFRSKDERLVGSWIWSLSLCASVWFGYAAGLEHAWSN